MKQKTIVLAKDENGKALNYAVYPDKENQRNANFKLGQYEDIEEEFQIDNFDDLKERLKTYKFLANHGMSCVDVEGYNCMLKDLKEYHDIEEELGIDLITLFKALKDGIYVKTYGCGNSNFNKLIITKKKCPTLKLDYKTHTKLRFEQKFGQHFETYELEDYGKTWALTKEELECQK